MAKVSKEEIQTYISIKKQFQNNIEDRLAVAEQILDGLEINPPNKVDTLILRSQREGLNRLDELMAGRDDALDADVLARLRRVIVRIDARLKKFALLTNEPTLAK